MSHHTYINHFEDPYMYIHDTPTIPTCFLCVTLSNKRNCMPCSAGKKNGLKNK